MSAPDVAARPPLVMLVAPNDTCASKRWRLNGGEPDAKPYDEYRGPFGVERFNISSVGELAKVVAQCPGHGYFISGQTVDDVRCIAHRRKRAQKKDPSVHTCDAPFAVVAVDCDDKSDVMLTPENASELALAVRAELPPPFSTAECVVQLTSSAGIKKGRKFRLWYLADRPTTADELTKLFGPLLTEKFGGSGYVDAGIWHGNTPIYAAAPRFEDSIVDPFPSKRIGILPGEPLRMPEQISAQEHEHEHAGSEASAAEPKPSDDAEQRSGTEHTKPNDDGFDFEENLKGASKARMPHDPIHEGARNDTLFRLACSYFRQGHDYDRVIALVRIDNEQLCDEPLTDHEVEAIVRSAEKYDWMDDAPAESAEAKADAWNFIDITRKLPPRVWLCEALRITQGRPSMIAGHAGGGKTIAAQALALSVASGKPIWGRYPCRQGTVLHFDYEMGSYDTSLRYQRLARGMGVDLSTLRGTLRVAALPRRNLCSDGIEDELIEMCEGVTLCLVDSLRAATPGADENESDFREYVDMWTRVGERTGCATLILHHATKAAEAGKPETWFRGTGGIIQAGGACYALEAQDKTTKQRLLRPVKTVHGEPPAAGVISFVDGEDGGLVVVHADASADGEANAKTGGGDAAERQMLAAAAHPRGVTSLELYRGARVKDKDGRAMRDALLRDGRLVECGKRYYRQDAYLQLTADVRTRALEILRRLDTPLSVKDVQVGVEAPSDLVRRCLQDLVATGGVELVGAKYQALRGMGGVWFEPTPAGSNPYVETPGTC